MSDARSNTLHVVILYKPFKVIVCTITLVAFLFTTVMQDLVWAIQPAFVIASPEGAKQSHNPSAIIIPENLGTIRDSWSIQNRQTGKPANRQTIIHIQDAHCNYYAQIKIAEIIGYLNEKYDVNTINLEGGAKDYDLSLFTSIADRAKRAKIADHFVKEGFVNGAEYFAINNPDKVTLWGVEDVGLYIDDLKTYRNSLAYKEEAARYLNNIGYILDNLKRKIYSRELLELDGKYADYKSGKLDLKGYLTYLIKTAENEAINVKELSNLYFLKQALDAEEIIDFEKANSERDAAIDKLGKFLSRAELEALVEKTVAFKKEAISQDEFYTYLLKKLKFIGIDQGEFAELKKYTVYLSMYNAADKSRVPLELDALEDRIKRSLHLDDSQKELIKLSKNLVLMRNLFDVSLTKDDYKYYKANEASFEVRDFESFIKRNAPLYRIQTKLDDNIGRLDGYREAMAKFYEYSLKRDAAFMKNLRIGNRKSLAAADKAKAARDDNYGTARQQIAIIVTGGFHTENLAESFRNKGISYISIMPNFKTDTGYECPYFEILSGEKHINLSNAVNSMAAQAMQVPSLLCPAMDPARDVAPAQAAPTASAERPLKPQEAPSVADATKPVVGEEARPEFFHGATINALLGLKRTGGRFLSSDKLIEQGIPILSGEAAVGSGLQLGDFVSTTTSFATALDYAQPVSEGLDVQRVRTMLEDAEAALREDARKGYSDVTTEVAERRVSQLRHLLGVLVDMSPAEIREMRDNDIPIVIGISRRAAPSGYSRSLLPEREVRIPGSIGINDVTEIYVSTGEDIAKVKKVLSDLGMSHIQVRLISQGSAEDEAYWQVCSKLMEWAESREEYIKAASAIEGITKKEIADIVNEETSPDAIAQQVLGRVSIAPSAGAQPGEDENRLHTLAFKNPALKFFSALIHEPWHVLLYAILNPGWSLSHPIQTMKAMVRAIVMARFTLPEGRTMRGPPAALAALAGPIGAFATSIAIPAIVAGALHLFGIDPQTCINIGALLGAITVPFAIIAEKSNLNPFDPRSDLAKAWRALRYGEGVGELNSGAAIPVTSGDRLKSAEVLLYKTAREGQVYAATIDIIREFQSLTPGELLQLFENVLNNKYGFSKAVPPAKFFVTHSPWEQAAETFIYYAFKDREDVRIVAGLLQKKIQDKDFVWRLLAELSNKYAADVVNALKETDIDEAALADLALMPFDHKDALATAANDILRNLLLSKNAPEARAIAAKELLKRTYRCLSGERAFSGNLTELALTAVEPDTEFENGAWRREHRQDPARREKLEAVYIDQIIAINKIFQNIFDMISKNPNITFNELTAYVSGSKSLTLAGLTKEQKVAIKAAIIRFFEGRIDREIQFAKDCEKYPIKEFSRASREMVELNAQKKALERKKDKASLRKLQRTIARHRARMSKLRREIAPYLEEQFLVPAKYAPEIAIIKLGPVSLEIYMDDKSLQNSWNNRAERKTDDSLTDLMDVYRRAMPKQGIGLEVLREVINRFPEYLYKNFQNEMIAYMTNGELGKRNMRELINSYAQSYLTQLVEHIKAYGKTHDMDDGTVEKIKGMVIEMWNGASWEKLERELGAARDLLDSLVSVKATGIYFDLKKQEPLAPERALNERAYAEASQYMLGIFQFVPITKIARLKGLLDRMLKELEEDGIGPDQILPAQSAQVKPSRSMTDKTPKTDIDKDNFYALGMARGGALFSRLDGGDRVIDHERQHIIFNQYTGREVMRYTRGSEDFSVLLNQTMSKMGVSQEQDAVLAGAPEAGKAEGTLHTLAFKNPALRFIGALMHEPWHVLLYAILTPGWSLRHPIQFLQALAKSIVMARFTLPEGRTMRGPPAALAALAGPVGAFVTSAAIPAIVAGALHLLGVDPQGSINIGALLGAITIPFTIIAEKSNLNPFDPKSDLSKAWRTLRYGEEVNEGDYVEVRTKTGETHYGVLEYDDGESVAIYTDVNEDPDGEMEFARTDIERMSPASTERLNKRRPLASNMLYGHGTNAYALMRAVQTSNAQLRPSDDQAEVPLTGESGGVTSLNQKAVSTVGLNYATSSMDTPESYADRMAGNPLTLDNIDRRIEGEKELLARRMQDAGSPRLIAIAEAMKRSVERLEAAKKVLLRLHQQGLYDGYLALSKIPVCIIGDGVIRGDVHGDIDNENVFKRVNIRVIGTRDEENVRVVREILKKAGVNDILVMEYGELNRLAADHKETVSSKGDVATELTDLIRSAAARAAPERLEGWSAAIQDLYRRSDVDGLIAVARGWSRTRAIQAVEALEQLLIDGNIEDENVILNIGKAFSDTALKGRGMGPPVVASLERILIGVDLNSYTAMIAATVLSDIMTFSKRLDCVGTGTIDLLEKFMAATGSEICVKLAFSCKAILDDPKLADHARAALERLLYKKATIGHPMLSLSLHTIIARHPQCIRSSTVDALEHVLITEGNGFLDIGAVRALRELAGQRSDLIRPGSVTAVALTLPEIITNHPLPHYKLYLSRAFEEAVAYLSPEESYSVGLAAHRILQRYGLEETEENISKAARLVIETRRGLYGQEIFSPRRGVINIVHGDEQFNDQGNVSLERRAGSWLINSFRGKDLKAAALAAVRERPGPITIYFNGHGGPNHLWLDKGLPGNEIAEDLGLAEAISYKELGDAIIAKAKAQGDGSISAMVILLDSCESYNFAMNLLGYLRESGISSFPIVVSSSNIDRFSSTHTFANSIEWAYAHGGGFSTRKPLTMLDIIRAENYSFGGQDSAIFVQVPGERLVKTFGALPQWNPEAGHDADTTVPPSIVALGAPSAAGAADLDFPSTVIEAGFTGTFQPVTAAGNNLLVLGEMADEVLSAIDSATPSLVRSENGRIVIADSLTIGNATITIRLTDAIDTYARCSPDNNAVVEVNIAKIADEMKGKDLSDEDMERVIRRMLIHDIAESFALQSGRTQDEAHTAGLIAEASGPEDQAAVRKYAQDILSKRDNLGMAAQSAAVPATRRDELTEEELRKMLAENKWELVSVGRPNDPASCFVYRCGTKMIHIFTNRKFERSANEAEPLMTAEETADIAMSYMGRRFAPTTRLDNVTIPAEVADRMNPVPKRFRERMQKTTGYSWPVPSAVYVEDELTPLIDAIPEPIKTETGWTRYSEGGLLAELSKGDGAQQLRAKRIIDDYFNALEEMWKAGVFNSDALLMNAGVNSEDRVQFFDLGAFVEMFTEEQAARLAKEYIKNISINDSNENLQEAEWDIQEYFIRQAAKRLTVDNMMQHWRKGFESGFVSRARVADTSRIVSSSAKPQQSVATEQKTEPAEPFGPGQLPPPATEGGALKYALTDKVRAPKVVKWANLANVLSEDPQEAVTQILSFIKSTMTRTNQIIYARSETAESALRDADGELCNALDRLEAVYKVLDEALPEDERAKLIGSLFRDLTPLVASFPLRTSLDSGESGSTGISDKTEIFLVSLAAQLPEGADPDLMVWRALRWAARDLDLEQTLQRLRLGVPVVAKRFRSMDDLRKLQRGLGDVEIYFTVINPDGADYPLVVVSEEGQRMTQGRLLQFGSAKGHTHAFEIALEASRDDLSSAKLYAKDGVASFVLSFPDEHRVELGWFSPELGEYIYEREDQEIVISKLQEFRLLYDIEVGLRDKHSKPVSLEEEGPDVETRYDAGADASYEGGRIFDTETQHLWEIIRFRRGNQLGDARYTHLEDVLKQYSDVMPAVYLVSRRDMDTAGIPRSANTVRFGNNIMIEEGYYKKRLSNPAPGDSLMDPLLNVLAHEMTAARLERLTRAGTVPMDAEGKADLEDWKARQAAHEGLFIDRSMEGAPVPSGGSTEAFGQVGTLTRAALTMPVITVSHRLSPELTHAMEDLPEKEREAFAETLAALPILPALEELSQAHVGNIRMAMAFVLGKPEYDEYSQSIDKLMEDFMKFWNTLRRRATGRIAITRIDCFEGSVWAELIATGHKDIITAGESIIHIGIIPLAQAPAAPQSVAAPRSPAPSAVSAPGMSAQEAITARKAVVQRGFETAGRGDVIKVLIGIDEGLSEKDIQEVRNAARDKLAAIGVKGDNAKVELYKRVKGDIDMTRANCEAKKNAMTQDLKKEQVEHAARAVTRQEHDGMKYVLVVFNDESEGEFDAAGYSKGAEKDGNVYIVDVPDAYTDCDIAKGVYPDIEYRAMLAVHIANDATRTVNGEALALLKSLLRGMLEDEADVIRIDNGILIFLKPIRIKPIYEKLEEWRTQQKALGTSV